MTRAYVRDWLKHELKELFVEQDRDSVIDWILAHRGIPKVVLIGSGFSRNAETLPGLDGGVNARVPLWHQVTTALRKGLGYLDDDDGTWDPLLLAEQYQEWIGTVEFRELLLGLLKDDELVPGEAHKALQTYPAEAIITTNQLDTLLDRLEGHWHPVRQCADLPVARARASKQSDTFSSQIIYLHGHRSNPETWVFSRSEYEDLACSRPTMVTRVQQLVSEYPLLVLGYSLSDPDFHALFRMVHTSTRWL